MSKNLNAGTDPMVPNIRRTPVLVRDITAAPEEQSAGVARIDAAVGRRMRRPGRARRSEFY